MEYTQKMYLVPQHQLDKLKQSTDVSIRRAAQTELDKEMAEVLDSPGNDMYDKAKKYAGILQRYLSLVKQDARENSVLTLSTPDRHTTDVGVNAVSTPYPHASDVRDLVSDEILKRVQKKSKKC